MAVGNNPNSPRQKMINLMYIVFIAMMALNVSSEVLEGFGLVEESLHTTIKNTVTRNNMVTQELMSASDNNPDKAQKWYADGILVNQASDSLHNYIQELKVQIVQIADGKNGLVDNIQNKEDLEAASRIMLAPLNGQGKVLREAIDAYRASMVEKVPLSKQKIIEESLSTAPPSKAGINSPTWEEGLFENMPVSAAITLLTKLQSDIRYTQGEVLANLLNQVDMGDSRVNLIKAQVIPDARFVISNTDYSANIVLSAIDSTQRPDIYLRIGEQYVKQESNRISQRAAGTGNNTIRGYVETRNNAGQPVKYEFEENFLVIPPSATVAPTKMNVLYQNYVNPLHIAVPGIPNANVTARLVPEGRGRLTNQGNGSWHAEVSGEGTVEVTVIATMENGRPAEMGRSTFRVLPLPDPVAFIDYKDADGNTRRFRGGRITKQHLMATNGILAGYVDGLLDATFTVLRFDLNYFDSFGLMMTESSQSTNFTDRQKDYIRNLSRGKRFYISNIVVRDPSGVERRLDSPLEVTLN
jgi:gliding motility-associated protein GldM